MLNGEGGGKCFSPENFEIFPSKKLRVSLLNRVEAKRKMKNVAKFLPPFPFSRCTNITLSERTEIFLVDCVMPPIFFQGSLDPSLQFIGNEFIGG